MFDNIKLLKLDPKDYYRDLLGLAITGITTNYIVYLLLAWFKNKKLLIPQYDYFPLSLGYISIALWLIAYLFLRKYFLLRVRPLLNRLSGGLLFENKYILNLSNFDKEWEFQGNINATNKGLEITNTPSGCVVKNDYWDTKVWKNISATFQVTFINKVRSLENDYDRNKYQQTQELQLKRVTVEFRELLGIIFRAQNLDDYFMLGIMKIGNRIVFRPHVRVAGNLDIPLRNTPRNTFKLIKNMNTLNFKILLHNTELKLFVKQSNKWVKCFYWRLPSLYKANLYEGKDNSDSEFITREIPFRDSPGMFGFRNYGNELAIIKSLEIRGKLSDEDSQLFNIIK